MKAKEMRELADDELAVELANLHDAVFKMRVRQVTENMSNAGEMKRTRRDIARCLTTMRQRELAKAKG